MNRYIVAGLTCLLFLVLQQSVQAQGCVAVRHFSNCSSPGGSQVLLQPGEWSLDANYRYFKSFRHFRGTHEEPQRLENNTEVINWQHSLNITATVPIVTRLSADLTVPLVYNTRSSLYEHGGNERHSTSAYGLGDMQLGLNYWLLDPYMNRMGNIMIGVAARFPTGNPNFKDTFYNKGDNNVTRNQAVDQSIQPGDGGFGFLTEFQANRQLTSFMGFYAGGFYLFNPREKNSTRTYREQFSSLRQNEYYMSVADQYAAQAGLSFGPFANTSLSVAGRVEGVPVRDVLGGSEGFRRPGYIWSFEPGLTYGTGNFSIGLDVPIVFDRARPQNVTEKEIEQITGEPTVGDAAFADYLINFNITWRFGKPKNDKQILDNF